MPETLQGKWSELISQLAPRHQERHDLSKPVLRSTNDILSTSNSSSSPLSAIDSSHCNASKAAIPRERPTAHAIFAPLDEEAESLPPRQRTSLIVKLKTRKWPRSLTVDPTQLPNNMLLNNRNFITWKIRVDEALRVLNCPTTDDAKPATTIQEEWNALSDVAARTIHNFVSPELLK